MVDEVPEIAGICSKNETPGNFTTPTAKKNDSSKFNVPLRY